MPIICESSASRYHAFMSYSHQIDRDLARVFQSDLERFGRRYPWSRQLSIFRDETNLSATPDLWGDIEQAIDASRRLILLASPPSSRSHWIPREIGRFVGRQGLVNVCIVLTRGKTPFTDSCPISSDELALSADMQALFGGGVEPRVVDLRRFRDAPRRARRSREYVQCVADVVAFVTGRNKDEIFSEHITRQRRWTLWIIFVAVAMSVLAGFSVRQTLAEKAASARALAGERAAKESEARAVRMRAITETQLRATQGRLVAREEPARALLDAARAWNDRPQLGAADGTQALALAAETQASAALAFVLETHPGLLGHFHGHTSTVESLAVDGDTLVSASNRGDVYVWDLATRKRREVVAHPQGAPLRRVVASDGIIAAASDEDILVHDEHETVTFRYPGASSIALQRHDGLVALGSAAGDVSILDLRARTVHPLARRQGFVTLAMSPRGERLYVGAMEQDNRIDIWDLATRRRSSVRLTGHSLGATHIVVSADGERVLAATEGDEVFMWDRWGRKLFSWRPETTVTSVAFDGQHDEQVYSAQADGTVITWVVGETKPQRVRYAHRGGTFALVHVANTDRLVTGGAGGSVRLWNRDLTDPLVRTLARSSNCAAAHFDGGSVVAVSSSGLRRWHTAEADPIDTSLPVREKLMVLAHHPQKAQLVLIPPYEAENHDLRVWSFTDSGRTRTLRNPSRTLHPVASSPDGSAFFASAPGKSGGSWRWDLDDEGGSHSEISATPADSIALSANGERVFAALANRELVVWQFSPWKELERATVDSSDSVTASAMDRDGRLIVIGRLSGDLQIHDATDLDRAPLRISHYREPIAALAFHPSGTWFAAGDSAGSVAVFDVMSGSLVLQLRDVPASRLEELEFDHTGKRLLVARNGVLALATTDPDAWARLAVELAGSP